MLLSPMGFEFSQCLSVGLFSAFEQHELSVKKYVKEHASIFTCFCLLLLETTRIIKKIFTG